MASPPSTLGAIDNATTIARINLRAARRAVDRQHIYHVAIALR
jgi:hypothetical protein